MKAHQPQRGCVNPDIALVPLDLVMPEQGPQLILKADLVVVLMLVEHVLPHLFKVGRTHGEVRVTTLPLEGSNRMLLLQPQVRHTLQFLDPFRLRNGSAEAGQKMNIVFYAARNDRRTSEL